MRPIIITELCKINNGKITFNLSAGNLAEQPPILNNGNVLLCGSSRQVSITNDATDETNKTWVLNLEEGEIEKIENEDVIVQYVTLMNLTGINIVPSLFTETVTVTNNTAKLTHAPWNLFGSSPVVNFGCALARSEKDGSILLVPTAPYKDDPEKKTITFPIDDTSILNDRVVTIQYLRQFKVEKLTKLPVVHSKTIQITGNTLFFTGENPNNIDDSLPLLNFGIVNTLPDEDGNVYSFQVAEDKDKKSFTIPETSEEDMCLLVNKNITLQYFRLVDFKEEPITTELLDMDVFKNGTASTSDLGINVEGIVDNEPKHFSELGITPEMIQRAREEAEQRDSSMYVDPVSEPSQYSRNDDIVDGEFTEVTE